ncbi:putative carbonic anhydrase [Amylocarpus encephaloides]|uniref:carbonic anhydrase n=1 Tax=Amylocarpus encephaloides TaxID=45428 RepID=A0A9P7YEX3_9HELO|nr:putative carbonic anhydrase [Amylocarpus encephaloides]
MKSSITSLALFLNLFIESTTASCGHGTSLARRKVHQKRSLSGEPVKHVEVGNFGYLGVNGPTNWQAIATENSVCKTSKVQSPIDINSASATLVEAGKLQLNFPEVEAAEFENLGTTIEVVMEGKNASTTVDGKTFELKQFHFHTPGEHTIDGEYFPLEMHMVHEAEDGAIAVIALPFQLCGGGGSTPLLNELVPTMDMILEPGTVAETGPLDFTALITSLNAQPFKTYAGSLTTPPCAEGLTFFVASQTLPLDVNTYNKMKKILGFNARFVQSPAGTENLLSM